MKITSVRLLAFSGAPDGTYSLCGPDGRIMPVVLVRGGGRAGKSSFVDAIAMTRQHLSMRGPLPPAERCLSRGARQGEIATTWSLSEAEALLAEAATPAAEVTVPLVPGKVPALPDAGLVRVFNAPVAEPAIGKVLHLGVSRAWPNRAEARTGLGEGLAQAAGDLSALPAALCEIADRDAARSLRGLRETGMIGVWDGADSLEPLRRLLAPLLPHLRLDGARRTERGPSVTFERCDGETFDVLELSTSERAIILVASLFFLLRLDHSVVLIDEPELHIAPAERAGWLQALQSFGTDNQLILASDAPELAAEIPKHQHIVLGGRP